MNCKGFYQGIVGIGEFFQSLFLLVIRLYWGYNFLLSGYGKLSDIPGTIEFFSQLHIPFPMINTYLVGGIEFFGGLFLILGLFSRIITIPLMTVMIGAYLTAHREAVLNLFSQPMDFINQSPFLYFLVCLIVFSFGPGKISLDHLKNRP